MADEQLRAKDCTLRNARVHGAESDSSPSTTSFIFLFVKKPQSQALKLSLMP